MMRLYREEKNLNLALIEVYADSITTAELFERVRQVIVRENPDCREFTVGSMDEEIKTFKMNGNKYHVIKL